MSSLDTSSTHTTRPTPVLLSFFTCLFSRARHVLLAQDDFCLLRTKRLTLDPLKPVASVIKFIVRQNMNGRSAVVFVSCTFCRAGHNVARLFFCSRLRHGGLSEIVQTGSCQNLLTLRRYANQSHEVKKVPKTR